MLRGLLLLWLLAFAGAGSASQSASTNNWAVLVCTSRFWFNYRHMANTLAMYRTVKRLGIPDSQIILMLADDVACNPRNPFAGTVYSNADRRTDLYGETIEVDYKGEEVNVEMFLRVLSGRLPEATPPSKRLMTDSRSNIFVYMTGHGGDEFLKFQDNEEISAFDLADAFGGMRAKGRYNEILFMTDTCQANTLYTKFYSPNIIATGSSSKNENSLSHHSDDDIGVAVTDRYTHHVLTFLEGINKTSKVTVQNLFDTFSFDIMHAHPGVRSDLFPRPLNETLLTEFFGGVTDVELSSIVVPADDDFEPVRETREDIERLRTQLLMEARANGTLKKKSKPHACGYKGHHHHHHAEEASPVPLPPPQILIDPATEVLPPSRRQDEAVHVNVKGPGDVWWSPTIALPVLLGGLQIGSLLWSKSRRR